MRYSIKDLLWATFLVACVLGLLVTNNNYISGFIATFLVGGASARLWDRRLEAWVYGGIVGLAIPALFDWYSVHSASYLRNGIGRIQRPYMYVLESAVGGSGIGILLYLEKKRSLPKIKSDKLGKDGDGRILGTESQPVPPEN